VKSNDEAMNASKFGFAFLNEMMDLKSNPFDFSSICFIVSSARAVEKMCLPDFV
jgi:hypothetical protein